MILAVRANMPTFREVEFRPGFNVVLADRTKESTRRDSRNGLGKTTLIEIIHFCLGGQTRRNQGLMVTPLKGWTFSLEMRVNGRELSVTRSTETPSWVNVYGDVRDLTASSKRLDGTLAIRTSEWNSLLGELAFGLERAPISKYHPTFRSLFSYVVRRGRDAFASPFLHYRTQQEWDKQVNNAFLLGLEWEHAGQLQELKDQENLLNSLRRAAREGLMEGMIGTLGNLEAERARVDSDVRSRSEGLDCFRVHPQYEEIEQEANDLTSTIQQLSNANLADGRLVDLYRSSLQDDQAPDADDVLAVYDAVGVTMPELVRRRLDEVEDFHRQIIANRRAYLESEIQRIEANRNQRELQIQSGVERRAQLLEVLKTHGALLEYTRLQELHLDLISTRNDLDNRISNLRRFEQGRSEVRVNKELLLQTARREFEERREVRERAINIFNLKSEELYNAPGNLVVDVTDAGFRFDVEIMRSGSQGINNMKIFCYDQMLAQLWANEEPSPGLLVHDSTVFDGVDERQVALALELAQREADRWGFQYVCALNSDTLPYDDFSSGFDLNQFVRIRFTDETEEGGLLGIRY
ncbi:MAG: DUF2326 domain-containing protein [Chloroflexi bacterium]|nr:DUF2326 domain-containing protein [Chloroflexota bacterium]